MAGGLARPLHRLRDDLLDLLAHLEAGFDFADEDLPFITREELDRRLAEAESDVAAILRQMAFPRRAGRRRAGPCSSAGRTRARAASSTRLAGDAAALVSDHPGTTRDYLTAELDLDGVKCRLIDTAGTGAEPLAVSHEAKPIEHAAATRRRRRNDARPHVASALPRFHPPAGRLGTRANCDAVDRRRATDRRADEVRRAASESTAAWPAVRNQQPDGRGHRSACAASCAERPLPPPERTATWSPARPCAAASRSGWPAQCLRRARSVAAAGQEELAAAEIRVALEELGKVVGAVYTDDVLDRIFSRFCIGK